MFYKSDRIALFIDASSLKNAARCNDMRIDYKKLRSEFANRGRLIRSYFYTPVPELFEQNSVQPLIDFLDYNGFHLRTRVMRESETDNGFRKALGYLRMEMAVDAADLAGTIDHAVIMCGDSEVTPVVFALKRQGVRVSICSTRKGMDGSIVSNELRRAADSFIDLSDLKDVVCMDKEAA